MTLKYLYGQDDLVAGFCAAMIPQCHRGFGKCATIGVLDNDNELIAGIVFNHADPDNGTMELSAAALPGKRWVTPETLRLMYTYPFIQCGCQMVLNKVLASDERHLRQLAELNYTLIAIPRMFGRDKDGVVCLLTYEAWCANKICRRYKHHVIVTTNQRKAA
jgi:hypothetical protein